MADPRFDVRMSAYERNQRAKAQQEAFQNIAGLVEDERNKQAKAQRDALQAMHNFHYRERAPTNAYTPPKPRTNPIGIPLIKQSGRYYE